MWPGVFFDDGEITEYVALEFDDGGSPFDAEERGGHFNQFGRDFADHFIAVTFSGANQLIAFAIFLAVATISGVISRMPVLSTSCGLSGTPIKTVVSADSKCSRGYEISQYLVRNKVARKEDNVLAFYLHEIPLLRFIQRKGGFNSDLSRFVFLRQNCIYQAVIQVKFKGALLVGRGQGKACFKGSSLFFAPLQSDFALSYRGDEGENDLIIPQELVSKNK